MADNHQQQQIDHYDFINAPQFVDFSDLAAQDDPDADRFFETHKEEDDFMIPLDINTISPTVQLLYSNGTEEDENNEHYSNEANKAAMAAGLEDVKIEYYASPPPPQQLSSSSAVLSSSKPNTGSKKSINSIYGTPLGGSGGGTSGSSTMTTSFYTPTGGSEDKENRTPTSVSSLKNGGGGSCVKASPQRNIFNDMPDKLGSNSSPAVYNMKSSGPQQQTATESLMSRLDLLLVVSSDEDDDTPTGLSPLGVHSTTVTKSGGDSLNVSNSNSSCVSDTFGAHDDEATFVEGQGQGLEVVQDPVQQKFDDSSDSSEEDEFGGEGGRAGSMEMHSPVNKILKILEEQLSLEDGEEMEENPRCSIVVAPKVGEQVHWTSDPHEDEGAGAIALGGGRCVFGGPAKELNVSYYVDGQKHPHANGDSYDASGDSTLELNGGFDISGGGSLQNQRASSVGDLVRAIELEPKQRQFETYGYNPRVGITIPKTPDVAYASGMDDMFDVQQPLERMNPTNLIKNYGYFEVEPPPKQKNIRRVSSCSDLISLQQKAKKMGAPPSKKIGEPPKRRGLTIPRTPDALKRSQKGLNNPGYAASNASSAGSTSSKCSGLSMRGKVGGAGQKPAGPSVSDRLAAARSRQPIKADHYVSMAEAMINYQKNTPDRFRSLPRGRIVPEKRATSADSRRRLAPSPLSRSPDCTIAATTYTRPNTAAGPVLPKKVELKPTIPKPFNLSCGQRNRPVTVVQKDEDVVDFKFKARPAPSKENASSHLLKSRPQIKITQPLSPHFASDDRLRERHEKEKRAQTKSPEPKKAKAVTTTASRPSRLPTSARSHHQAHSTEDHKTTVTRPFSSSFDARQKEILRRKEEKIKQEIEEARKGREFHANPVPKYSSSTLSRLPKKKPVEVTHVEPFRLKSDERGAHYQEQFKKKLEEEEQRLREAVQFHAQPADVVHKPPFEPEKPTRIIEGPLDFHLATEKRAVEREQFDEHLREREREEEEKRKEEQETLEELQRQEDLERRRQLVHKAQPFKAPKPFQLKASGKALTVPQSPAFSALPSERRILKPNSPHQQSNSFNH